MTKNALALELVGFLALATPNLSYGDTPKPRGLVLKITNPSSGSEVDSRLNVEGTTSDPKANIYVVIIPDETGQCWIQPSVTIDSTGTWSTMVYVGRAGKDFGKTFKLKAIANPSGRLAEGLVPCDQISNVSTMSQSNVVAVSRHREK